MNGISFKPGYVYLHRNGVLRERAELLWDRMHSCNLGCVFCQNWDLSLRGSGRDCNSEDLAAMML